jgi:hypothetical protein
MTPNIQLTGLQKSQRLAIDRAEKQKASAVPPLDPDFPYSTNSFDPSYFGIPADPMPNPNANPTGN